MSHDYLWSVFDYAVGFETGFPFEWLDALRMVGAAGEADVLKAADGRLALSEDALVSAIKSAVREASEPNQLQWLSKARRQTRTGSALTPPPAGIPDHVRQACDAVVAERAHVACAEARLRRAYGVGLDQAAAMLFEFVERDAFADSLVTTSPQLYQELVRMRTLTRSPQEARPQLLRRLSFYLARGALKTHVASRLGTTLFARFAPGPDARTHMTPPEGNGLARRRIFISYWAALSLAHKIFEAPDLFDTVKPALKPAVQLCDRGVSLLLHGQWLALDPPTRKLLDLVDGHREVAEIARLLECPGTADRIRSLAKAQVLHLDFVPPVTMFDPIEFVKDQVETLPIGPARQYWRTALARLTELCEEYENAVIPERATLSLAIETAFSEMAACSPRRNHGATYGDRRVFYEECLSDLAPVLDAGLTRRFENEVGLALEPCLAYGRILRRKYRALSTQAFTSIARNGEASFCEFVHRLQQMALANALDLRDPLREQFETLWTDLVHAKAAEAGGHVARLTATDLAPLRALAPEEEISRGAHATVDIFLAAGSPDSIAAGDFTIVIGEVGENVMPWGSQFYFADERETIETKVAARIKATPGYDSLAMILPPRIHKGFLNQSFTKAGLLIGAEAPSGAPADELPIRDLRVFFHEGKLSVGGPDRKPLQLFHHHDDLVHLWSFAAPRVMIPPVLPRQRRVPRIMVGNVCLQRAQFHVNSADLAHANDDPVAGLRRLARLQQTVGLPERVFVHVPSEPKPLFLDFRSSLALLTAQHLAAKADELRLVEMYPAANQLWDRRDDGRRAVEFRVLMTRTGGR